MALIPDEINGVRILFKPDVDRDVADDLISALEHLVRPYAYGRLPGGETGLADAAEEVEEIGRFLATSLTVSAASDTAGHSTTSRHYMRKAIDISRLNGLYFFDAYPSDDRVRAVVARMQELFHEFAPARRENFGPYMCRKVSSLGDVERPDQAEKHKNHIHFSVN